MRPVHELTPDEAVLELERVCDDILDAPSTALLARKRELEAWILMHQVQTPKPEPPKEPEPMTGPLKGRTRTPEAIAKGVATRLANAKAKEKELAPRPVPRATKESAKPRSITVEAETTPLRLHASPGLSWQIRDLRRQLWLLMALLETTDTDQQALVVPDLALLDAAAHAAHQLALGRLEVA